MCSSFEYLISYAIFQVVSSEMCNSHSETVSSVHVSPRELPSIRIFEPLDWLTCYAIF